MKKIFIMVLLCAIAGSLKAQYSNFILNSPANPYYIYVGSLRPSDGSNFEKLKIDVFGGAWESISNGETTYYVANRDALSVNQVTMGSSNGGRITLKAYNNTTTGLLDFYILTNNWTAISIKSYIMDGTNNGTQLVPITLISSPPAGQTEQVLTVNPVIITDPNGNMGFGTYNVDAGYKLSVGGAIRATEIKVETGWADYVFDKGYQLKPLKEIENYINQNKHLPDVPSAAEVAKNGVKVGETEALLLKKVEELTLYLIVKDKEVKALQERLNKLEKTAK